MKLRVKTLKNVLHTVDAEPNQTVAELKAIVFSLGIADPSSQSLTLIYSGRVLKDQQTVAELQLSEASVLVAMTRPLPNAAPSLAKAKEVVSSAPAPEPKPEQAAGEKPPAPEKIEQKAEAVQKVEPVPETSDSAVRLRKPVSPDQSPSSSSSSSASAEPPAKPETVRDDPSPSPPPRPNPPSHRPAPSPPPPSSKPAPLNVPLRARPVHPVQPSPWRNPFPALYRGLWMAGDLVALYIRSLIDPGIASPNPSVTGGANPQQQRRTPFGQRPFYGGGGGPAGYGGTGGRRLQDPGSSDSAMFMSGGGGS